jgi:ATP-dependent DNA ligase
MPLQLTPVTYDADEALEWFEVLPAAMGVEGLVLKPTAARYIGGRRSSWAKINSIGVEGVWSVPLGRNLRGQVAVRRLAAVRDRCRGHVAAMVKLAKGLAGPVDFELARSEETLPGNSAMPGRFTLFDL